ncbi:MAG: SMP-30/gluconolactonase/LRE family protein [Armatimonadetes bacterium]|nr:SMP-30/gluconolactonase/LRE family protein [Armatimonadota bacterium]
MKSSPPVWANGVYRPVRFLPLLLAIGSLFPGCRVTDPSSPTIQVVAGTGSEGFSGDHGPAPAAQLYSPCGVDVDPQGNLYFADSWNQRIRKVDPQGQITTLAGTGVIQGETNGAPAGTFTGESGPALNTGLNQPNGIALDRAGNLYIADGGNHRVRKLTPDGRLTTVAGNGGTGASKDGIPAVRASLGYPFDVALDRDENLYIADSWNHRIWKVDPKGILTAVAGNGKQGFSGDGGPATAASLSLPNSVVFDAKGDLYIADEENHRVRKVDRKGIITTVAGNGTPGFSGDGGPALLAQLHGPSGVEVDGAGHLFIADRANHRVRQVAPDGTITTLAGNGKGRVWRMLFGYGEGGPAEKASLAYPRHLKVGPDGTLYLADGGNDRVCKIEGVAGPGLFNGRPY